jgi:predicted HTH transcriptional regulator
MYNILLERWLYESENDSLEFKRDQYKFIRASDEEKSELLKDILAMVNSWRRVDGYIVIGIEDKPEKPNILQGISEHIDDSKIQQFVNSKVLGGM